MAIFIDKSKVLSLMTNKMQLFGFFIYLYPVNQKVASCWSSIMIYTNNAQTHKRQKWKNSKFKILAEKNEWDLGNIQYIFTA